LVFHRAEHALCNRDPDPAGCRRRCVAHGQWLEVNLTIRDELLAQAEAAAQEIDGLQRDGAA